MSKRKTQKKIIFVIVEGPSDDTALSLLLTRIFDKNMIYVQITHGDITSDFQVNPTNIVMKITKLIKDYAVSNHYRKNDFLGVIHIVDMDGAFIGDDQIVYDESCGQTFYTENEIYTNDISLITDRNRRKRNNLNRICSLPCVWETIPYRCYYRSCNLDHVLYDIINSDDQAKKNHAYQFVKRYKDCIDEFVAYMNCSPFSVVDDYNESWKYIKENGNSLKRYSNLGIAFQKEKVEV